MIVREPSLIVTARVADALEQALTDAETRVRRDGLRIVDPDVAQTLADFHALAAWWRAFVASAPARPPTETPSSSGTMTPSQVADRWGVTPSRVRQMLRAGTLTGERTNGRWHVDPAALEARTPPS